MCLVWGATLAGDGDRTRDPLLEADALWQKLLDPTLTALSDDGGDVTRTRKLLDDSRIKSSVRYVHRYPRAALVANPPEGVPFLWPQAFSYGDEDAAIERFGA